MSLQFWLLWRWHGLHRCVECVPDVWIFMLAILADIDECDMPTPCGNNSFCINTNGSFYCVCQAGFTGDGLDCEGQQAPNLAWGWGRGRCVCIPCHRREVIINCIHA